MISDEVALILKGQNVASPAIDEVVASLKALRTVVVSTTKSFGPYNDGLLKIIATSRDAAVSVGALTDALRLQAGALADVNVAQRAVSLSTGANTVAGTGGRRTVVSEADQIAIRAGGAGLTQSGGFALGGVSGGAGVLGSATVPAIVAAVVGYLGFKSVNVANEFNQSVRDVIASSSQNLSQVPIITQGILNLAGGQNRFTPQQIQAAQYAVQSTPLFANNPTLALGALSTISQQGQPYGAAALPALAQADTGAFNAFHLSNQSQFAQVANIIARGVNVGAAEPSDFAKGIGTFSASGYAAGLTGTTGLSQLAGAFAQGSILSPRFRFDAQGLNAFLQQVNGKQTAGASAVESNLGITGLFGVGSIGKAGGLPQWLSALQNATGALGPDQQQQFLQSIFTRQNALQAVRGLTGQNFSTAQQTIAATMNYTGTVAAGAKIADTGPQAQFDQIQSTFNKDVIEIGTTISGTLNPALASLGTAALDAAGVLGGILGKGGSWIDSANAWLNQKATQLNLPQKLGYANLHPEQFPYGTNGVMASAMPGEHENPQAYGATAPNPYVRTINSLVNPRSFTGGRAWGSLIPSSPAAMGATTANANNGVLSALGTTADQAGTAVGSLAQHLVIFANGVGSISRAVTAANALNATHGVTPGQQLTLDRGSLQYQLNVGASNSTLNAAVAKIKADLGLSGKSPTEQRNLLEQYTKPVTTVENQRIVQSANTRYGALQDQLTLDKLKNLPTAQDIKTLSDFITTNRKALGLDPVQAQIAVLQLQQSSALVKSAQVQLIRPTDIGAGHVFSADFGGAVASLASGKEGPNSILVQLQHQVAYLQEQNGLLRAELGLSKSSDTSLKAIAATNAVIAKAAQGTPTPASRAGMLHSIGNPRK